MKEIELLHQDKTEIANLKPIKREHKLVHSIKKHKGHTCYELNIKTGEISEAKFQKVDALYNEAQKSVYGVKRKILMQPDCIYVTALNKKNALKKFAKMITNAVQTL